MKVIQCWDDGISDDIRLGEILRRYGAKATFCLNPGLYKQERSLGWIHGDKEVWRLSFHELVSVYEGFEIASHSMTHPYLTDLPSDSLWWEISESKKILESIFNKAVAGFCYPFNSYNNTVKDMIRSAGYLWARGGAEAENAFPPPDPFEFNFNSHFLSESFWKKFYHSRDQNSIFSFWGHSCELVTEEMWRIFEETIERITDEPNVAWSNVSDVVHLFCKGTS